MSELRHVQWLARNRPKRLIQRATVSSDLPSTVWTRPCFLLYVEVELRPTRIATRRKGHES